MAVWGHSFMQSTLERGDETVISQIEPITYPILDSMNQQMACICQCL